ncbi:MAG: hypothetical protein BWY52_03155 [Chloroflexi bacterium ADurb.Bin325]|nr:MAG: hypothetical protein BWY52_03155 [Chloroflexi bacterium ADurb.Bin325]
MGHGENGDGHRGRGGQRAQERQRGRAALDAADAPAQDKQEREHLQRGGDRVAQRQPAIAQAAHQRDAEADAGRAGGGRQPQRGDGVLQGEEGARGQLQTGVRGQPQRIEAQRHVDRLRRRGVELPALIEQRQQRPTQQDQRGGRGRRQRQDGAQRLAQGAPQPRAVVPRGKRGQRREGHQPERGADDRFGQLHGVPAPFERADAARAEPRGQIGRRQEAEVEDAEVEHARPHQPDDPAHAPAARGQRWPPAKAVVDERGDLDEQMEQRADDRADGKPAHAPCGRQPQRGGRDAQGVDDGRERGKQEVLEAVEHAALHRADAEDDRGDEHDAHDAGRLGLLRGVEAGRDDRPHEPRRKDAREERERPDHQHDPVRHRGRQPPCAGPIIGREKVRKHRDERGRQRAARHDREQQVGQLEGRVVGVQARADAEGAGDDHVAEEARGRGQRKRGGHHQHIARQMALGPALLLGHGSSASAAAASA